MFDPHARACLRDSCIPTTIYRTSFLTQQILPDDHGELVPPESISNSEVKRLSADGSVGFPHVRVGRRQALLTSPASIHSRAGRFSFPLQQTQALESKLLLHLRDDSERARECCGVEVSNRCKFDLLAKQSWAQCVSTSRQIDSGTTRTIDGAQS